MSNAPVSPPKKNIFIFDKNKCVACQACLIACVNENGLNSTEFWRTISHSNPIHKPDLPLFYLSIACNHCDEAPCMKSCPSLSFFFDKNTGAVLHDPESCIGCKFCTWVCPYDAPKYNSFSGIIEKCTFCNHRIEVGLKPACANLCPTGALDFRQEEFNVEDVYVASPVAKKVGPSIKIIELENPNPPKVDRHLFEDLIMDSNEISAPKTISAIRDWPLVIFTILVSLLPGLYLTFPVISSTNFLRWIILAIASFAAFFSLWHLGKKSHAWKAVLNIEKSWLSREILFFMFFFASLTIDLFLWDIPKIIPVINGVLMLISIDMLYRPFMGRKIMKMHSAHTLFIALSIWLVISPYFYLFLALSFIRISLYLLRKTTWPTSTIRFTIFRIGLLILGSCLVFLSDFFWLGFGLVLFGEILDRIEFYNELEKPDGLAEF